MTDIHIHNGCCSHKTLEKILVTQDEILALVTDMQATVAKIGTESSTSLALIQKLEAELTEASGGPIDSRVADALTALKAQLQAVDDLVPDAPAVDPTPPTDPLV